MVLVAATVLLAGTTLLLVIGDRTSSGIDTPSDSWTAPVLVVLRAVCVIALTIAVVVARSSNTHAVAMSDAVAQAVDAVNDAHQRELHARGHTSDRSESELISTLSHELRTPLTSILGYSELLDDHLGDGGDADSLPREAVEMIQRNGERLLLLVDDLLTLSAIESPEVELARRPCDVTDILVDAVTTLGPRASARRVQIVTDIQSTPPVSADPGQLERAVMNLVDNAVKFSPERSVVRVSCTSADGEVELRIEDAGPGIPSAQMDRLFTRFYRAPAGRTTAVAGTGLGLTIVASIVERHGGQVWLESEEGTGTTAVVRLPVALDDAHLVSEAS